MNLDPDHLTPDRARQQLELAQTTRVTSPTDRRVHAVATAVLGFVVGVFAAAQNRVSGASDVALSVAFVVLCIGVATWVERVARTVPRRARWFSRAGLGVSFAVGLFLVMPVLNLNAQTEPNSLALILGGASVIALPSLVAAALILRGAR